MSDAYEVEANPRKSRRRRKRSSFPKRVTPKSCQIGALLALTATTLAYQDQIPIRPLDHSQGYQFNPLLHLPGTSPYFDAVGFGLQHKAPDGCTVNAASYLIRHGAIYANDDEYEEFIKPFLYKHEKHRGGFSGPLEFLNKWQSPIDEDNLEELTPSGANDSVKVGAHIARRYPELAKTVSRVVADTKPRTFDTAKSFIKEYPKSEDIEIVRFNKKQLNNGTRALLPHKACSIFSKSPGADEQNAFLDVYGSRAADRLSPYTPDDYKLDPKDILALQSICGYETGITGHTSPACSVFTDAEWMSYEYMWDMKYAYMVGPLNKLSNYLGMPWLTAQADLFDAIDGENNSGAVLDDDDNTDPLTGWPKSQRLFLSFTHREVPPVVATALGLFNNSASCGFDEFPTSHINWARSWRMSDLIPFLGHVGMEKMICNRPGAPGQSGEYIRFIANTAPRPLPFCQSGPGASCPFEEFKEIIKAGNEKYGDFDGVCENDK
ncbi:hypothetical protein LTS08_008577 [Lithohypha guttulata]|uniref:uncharacterized protein n=1 Tax=Lithohypha guttulata TaxID=1690604 RepID=UPI002DE0811A|nr:hypothetical protein LTS08_008577 [Lithohypha guttulata]